MTVLADDVTTVSQWWAAVRPAIPAEVRGLWFGLLDPDPDDPEPDVAVAVTGTARLDLVDPAASWASARVWSPPGPAPLRALRGAGAGPTTDDPLRTLAELLREALDPARLPLRVEGVAIGWEGGPGVVLWTRADGWRPTPW